MTDADPHFFDRRKSDVRTSALDTRVAALEEHVFRVLTPMVEDSRREMATNTAFTEETHGWVAEVRDDLTERREQTAEMYEVFTLAKNGVHVIAKVGNGVMWAAERAEKLAKPLLFLTLSFGAIWAWATGGEFHWPKWPP